MTVTEMPPQGKFVSQGQRYSESPFFLRRDPPDPHRSHVADPAFLQQAQAALVDPENTCRYPSRARGRVPAENARHRMAAAPSRVSFLQVGHSLPRLEPYEKWSASRFFEVQALPCPFPRNAQAAGSTRCEAALPHFVEPHRPREEKPPVLVFSWKTVADIGAEAAPIFRYADLRDAKIRGGFGRRRSTTEGHDGGKFQ